VKVPSLRITFTAGAAFLQVKAKEIEAFKEGKMKTRLIATIGLAVGMATAGVSTLSAQEWRSPYVDHRDIAADHRDVNRDYARVNAIRADIARDQARLNEDIRCGRRQAAYRDRLDLARDNAQLNAQLRDIRHDRNDIRRDYDRDWR
jgi:hypothetical protein